MSNSNIKDVAGRPMQFDALAAESIVKAFLRDKYPANQGVFKKSLINRGIAALKRQAAGREIGGLEREFTD